MGYCSRGRGVWYRSLTVHNRVWRSTWTKGWYALPQVIELMSEHVDFARHVLMALLEVDYKIDGCGGRLKYEPRTRERDIPLLRISHLLAFMPRSAGS